MATSAKQVIIGVMGGGHAEPRHTEMAYRLGHLIAAEGWILLNGGRHAGIMDASARGACEKGGITVGVLPDADDRHLSPHILIPILTGMGSGRNTINALSSHVMVACPGGAGTLSEIALALKHDRPVILLDMDVSGMFAAYVANGQLKNVATPAEAIDAIKFYLKNKTFHAWSGKDNGSGT
jgi:uncharacterized protein (TIGR00725 family)